MRKRVKVWFCTAGHWFVAFEDSTVEKAMDVHLDNAATDYRAEGFRDLPGGPRGIIVGELVAMSPVTVEA